MISKAEWVDILFVNKARVLKHIQTRCSRSSSGCLLWSGAVTCGYPVVSIKTSQGWRAIRVSRFLLALADKLDISDETQEACHSCDTPNCLEFEHLFPGTGSQNMQDALKKGRIKVPKLFGEKHPRSRFTSVQVSEIRVSKLPQRELANKFGVSKYAIWSIQKGLTRRLG